MTNPPEDHYLFTHGYKPGAEYRLIWIELQPWCRSGEIVWMPMLAWERRDERTTEKLG